MPSNEHAEPLDEFLSDFKVSPEESETLWGIREKHNRMTPEAYLDFLNVLTKDKPPTREVSPRDATPFTL